MLHENGVTLQPEKASPRSPGLSQARGVKYLNKMGKKTLFIIVVLSLLCSCGDNKKDRQLLDNIEQTWQLCETSLPEAQARSEGLRDSVKNASEYVRQKYNLLTIRLRDKGDAIPSSPDSAMQTLTYFTSRKNAVDKERAYYYAGSAYRDLKDYPRAVSHFLTAVDIARQNKAADTLIWQNSLSQLRYLYMLELNYEEELKMALQAVELASPGPSQGGVNCPPSPGPSQGRENGNGESGRNLGCYLVDVASAYHHLNDTLHCLQYCDQAYRVIREEGFPPKYGRVLSYMMAIYSKYNYHEKLDTLLHQLAQLPEDQRPNNYEICLAKFHEYANNTDSAICHYQNYYNKEKSIAGRYEASAGLQRCYLQKGNLLQATQWGCRLYETNDSIIDQRAFEQTQRARVEYVYHRDKEEERAIRQRDQQIIFVSVITGLALIIATLCLTTFYYFRKKKFMEVIIGKDMKLGAAEEEIRRRTNELEQKKQEIELLGRQLEEAERTIAASEIRLEGTMKDLEQKVMINRELTRIALMNNMDENAERVIAHFREVASGRASLRNESWKELVAAIETLYPGFQEKVQERLNKQLREPLLYTICLMKIGLKPIQIARVMDAKIQTVWNRVKRAEEICGDLLSWQKQNTPS